MYTRFISAVLQHLLIAFLVYAPCCISFVSGVDEFSDGASSVLKFMQDTLGDIQNYVGEPSGCRYTCPDGSKPKRRKGHKPSSDGCGSFGFKLEKYISVKEVTECCDEHDICYDTCNNSKQICDNDFKSCLEKLCKKIKKVATKDAYEACLSTADLMYAGTVALGCKPYKDSQEMACICDSESPRYKHREL